MLICGRSEGILTRFVYRKFFVIGVKFRDKNQRIFSNLNLQNYARTSHSKDSRHNVESLHEDGVQMIDLL